MLTNTCFFRGLCLTKIRKYSTELLRFVPKHNEASEWEVQLLRTYIENSNKILVITGAGISTESGIPDYRSEEVGLYARTNHRPIQYQEFLKHASIRKRYWARNFVGWENFSKRQPNAIHISIKNLEVNLNKVSAVVTQNVDNLHFKAGSKNVIELHGSGYRVICMSCKSYYSRHDVQAELKKTNPDMPEVSTMVRPDGDVDIPQEAIAGFQPPFCNNCGGILKPDIIFFGDNVPKEKVEAVKYLVSESDSLLVLGSSISVFSGYRIILQAVDEKKKIAIVNIGPTRADKHAHLKLGVRCGDILPKIC